MAVPSMWRRGDPQTLRLHHTYAGAGRTRQIPNQFGPNRSRQFSREVLRVSDCVPDDVLNMTEVALRHSHYVNGVALRHEEISRNMFPGYPINSITNGVHAVTWAAEPIKALFDHHFPEWRRDNLYLRYAGSIPLSEILNAHSECKRQLIEEVKKHAGVEFDPKTLTLGFARRATAYKRADLLFNDLDRLRRIVRTAGRVQVIYAGKAHPHDEPGKEMIRRVFAAADALRNDVPVVFLPEYDMDLARTLCAGADVWLNTPLKPQEASGTSGMKAAINGVPSLSVLDGWWVEGCTEGITGWAIGEDHGQPSDPVREATSLYDKLEYVVAPLFYSALGIRRGHAVGHFAQRLLLQRRAHGLPILA